MNKEVIYTDQAPAPIGPYKQAIKANGFVYTSGQIPLDCQTGEIVGGGIEGQTKQVLEYLKAILESAQLSLNQVIKTTVFLSDMEHFSKMNAVYLEYFSQDDPPARSTIEVARLPKDVLVEIEAVALG